MYIASSVILIQIHNHLCYFNAVAVRSEEETVTKERCWWVTQFQHLRLVYCLWHVYHCTDFSTHDFYPDIQRRIELIQDFEMPTVCTSIKVSRDGQFILAAGKQDVDRCFTKHFLKVTVALVVSKHRLLRMYQWPSSAHIFFPWYLSGTYKPRIRCYDTYQLSLKFERCLDSDGKSADPTTCWMAPTSCTTQCDAFLFSLSKLWLLTSCLMTTLR